MVIEEEVIMDWILTLSNLELFKEIRNRGFDNGPVTATTRRVFERKLMRVLLNSNEGWGWAEVVGGDASRVGVGVNSDDHLFNEHNYAGSGDSNKPLTGNVNEDGNDNSQHSDDDNANNNRAPRHHSTRINYESKLNDSDEDLFINVDSLINDDDDDNNDDDDDNNNDDDDRKNNRTKYGDMYNYRNTSGTDVDVAIRKTAPITSKPASLMDDSSATTSAIISEPLDVNYFLKKYALGAHTKDDDSPLTRPLFNDLDLSQLRRRPLHEDRQPISSLLPMTTTFTTVTTSKMSEDGPITYTVVKEQNDTRKGNPESPSSSSSSSPPVPSSSSSSSPPNEVRRYLMYLLLVVTVLIILIFVFIEPEQDIPKIDSLN